MYKKEDFKCVDGMYYVGDVIDVDGNPWVWEHELEKLINDLNQPKVNPQFRSTMNKGFAMTFENGWTISVQWGTGNYCEARDLVGGFDAAMKVEGGIWKSPSAEIAIWSGTERGEFNYQFENGDTVRGWCSPDEVASWINKVSNFKPIE